MAGRKTTPLFELMSRGASATPAPPVREKPVVRVELKPRDPSYAPAESAGEAMAAAREGPETWGGLPIKTWSFIGLGAMVLVLVAWVIGWSAGKQRGEKEMEPFVRRDPPAVVEPEHGVIGPGRADVPLAGASTRTGGMTASTGVDPRESGKNYLYLATLPRADAERAVAFLRENKVDAHYFLVETGAGSANNQGPGAGLGLGRVFVLPGLTKEEYSQSIRTNLEAEVVRLGTIWRRDHRGTSNFEKYGWEKFK